MIVRILHQILLLISFVVIFVLVHNVASVIACLALRIRVKRFCIFYGKPIVMFQTWLCPVAIGCLPIGGYVELDLEEFERRPLLTRWLVVGSAPLATLISACFVLRYDVATAQFASAFPQLFRGALAPFELGVPLIRAFFARATDSFFVGYGILAAKCTAVNLLPFPAHPGGRLLTEIPAAREESALGRALGVIGVFVGTPMIICWSVAIICYFIHL